MEALVQHCVQEIAHDGDLGSTLTRVGSFMNEFYTRSPPPTDEERSTFQALFEVLRKEPHIVIGLAASANAEVVIGHPERIAKKPTQGKKPSSQYTLAGPDHATANGGVATPEAETEMDDAATPSKQITPPGLARPAAEGLQLIPDAATIPSMDLVSTFGEKLRIAVDPEFACYTLTGMPNRSMARTNPRMYTCLQFISRARGNGLSADALATATTYDQKICYHHIRHLVSLDLIVKVRKNDFSRVDFCIHRDFKDIIPADWMLRTGKEKDEKQQGASARGSVADDVEFESGSERLDPKHEASPRLLRERVFAVFAESSETSIPYTQLFAATGYVKSNDGADWDFFCATVEDMVRDGEVVKSLKKAAAGAPVLCVRLPSDETPDPVAARMQPTRMRPRRSVNNGNTTIDDDDSGMDISVPHSSTSMKRPADEAAGGEPPLKRKRGRPRKEEVEARAAAPDSRSARKDDQPRAPSPPWASKRKGGPRPPSPVWVPKRVPTPPWIEGSRPGRPQTPLPPPPPRHTPASLAAMDAAGQLEYASNMIVELERRNEGLVAGAEWLTAQDLRTLLPGQLPNATVMDALNSMMMVTAATLPRVHIGSTALYPYIVEAVAESAKANADEPHVWRKALMLQERVNLFSLHRFVIPVYLPERWICACIDFKSSMISIYDSMPKPLERMHMTTIRALSTWLDHEAKARRHPVPDWKVWKADSAPKDVVKSDDKKDTGFYAWLFARTLVMQERIDMTFRLDVASERIWLIVDGIQSLEHIPVPPPGTLYDARGARFAARAPRPPPANAPRPPAAGTSRPPALPTARPPPAGPGPRPSPADPNQPAPRASSSAARRPSASAQRPPQVPGPAQRPSPAPAPPPRAAPAPRTPIPPPQPSQRPSPELTTRPRQDSGARTPLAPLPPPPADQGRRASHDSATSSAKENQTS